VAVARRSFVGGGLALAMLGKGALAMAQGTAMYGMIARIRAQPGQRAALAAILTQGSGTMAGCLSYVVAEDLADPEALLVTEIWDSKASHEASLALPAVKEAIQRGRPLIAGFDKIAETRPVGGVSR
jgi:quinol monooxygenase YgiN